MIETLRVEYRKGAGYTAALAADGRALARVARVGDEGILTFHTAPGRTLLIGRYHVVPPTFAQGVPPIPIERRRTGGRAVPYGDGFVGMSLVLPHRAGLSGSDWRALAPEQVINRCVRGLLHGLRALGVAAFYPGRDVVTVDGRVIATVAFETTLGGAMLFEAHLACAGDFSIVPGLLDRGDPAGIIATAAFAAERVTTVAAAAGRMIDTEELGASIARGYAQTFRIALATGSTTALESSPAADGVPGGDAAAWRCARMWRPELAGRGTIGIPVGVIEAFSARADDRLQAVMLAGDFLANAAAIDRLEQRLVGAPLEWASLAALVYEEFGRPENFLLGVGDLGTVAAVILRSARSSGDDGSA
jgi:lipoate-protein ligase A